MQRTQIKKAKADVLEHLGDSPDVRWKCFCKHLKRCRKKVSPEAVHDSRVATRRLLSTIELLAPFTPGGKSNTICAALKNYLDCFDDLRDAHVQLENIEPLIEAFPVARSFQKWLAKRKRRFARRTRKAANNFRTRRLARRITALQKEIRHSRKTNTRQKARSAVSRSINQSFKRVVQLRKRIRPDDTKTIHCTRVAFKHFRYMVEELSPLLPGITNAHCEAMHDYQSKMGDIQDLEVLLATFDEFLCRKKTDPAQSARLAEELKHREEHCIEIYLRSADDLNTFKP